MVVMTDLKIPNSKIDTKDENFVICTSSPTLTEHIPNKKDLEKNNLNDDNSNVNNNITLDEDLSKLNLNVKNIKTSSLKQELNSNLDTKLSIRFEIYNSNKLCTQSINKNYEPDYSNNVGQITNEFNNYVCIQNDVLNNESFSVSNVLNYCKNYVFKPYYRLVSLVGLRPIFGTNTIINLSQIPLAACFLNTINILYTFVIISIILIGYLLQLISCYREDGFPMIISYSLYNKSNFINSNSSSIKIFDSFQNNDFESISSKNYLYGMHDGHLVYKIQKHGEFLFGIDNNIDSNKDDENKDLAICSGNLFTLFLIPDFLNLIAYIFTIYLMRASEIEKTEHLLEKGFLQASRTTGWLLAHRKLLTRLRLFLYLAFIWFMISLINHILQAIILDIEFTFLDQLSIKFKMFSLQNWKMPFLVFTICALIIKDLICSVIIASYAIHCELNISFIQNLCRSLREKQIELQEFVKGIEELRKFLYYLNHQQSFAVSLHTITMLSQLLHIAYKLIVNSHEKTLKFETILLVNISLILWFTQLLTPLIQASRLSDTCDKLRHIGLELRSRPFGYQDTLQQDLDSILIYTSSLHLRGKILHLPIKKSFLWILFSGLITILLFLGQINYI